MCNVASHMSLEFVTDQTRPDQSARAVCLSSVKLSRIRDGSGKPQECCGVLALRFYTPSASHLMPLQE